MAKKLDDILASIDVARRVKIEARASELAESKKSVRPANSHDAPSDPGPLTPPPDVPPKTMP